LSFAGTLDPKATPSSCCIVSRGQPSQRKFVLGDHPPRNALSPPSTGQRLARLLSLASIHD
ncbi:MAG: hypothetical protein ACK53L_20305, partial [Pirellulaceae bacterium]